MSHFTPARIALLLIYLALMAQIARPAIHGGRMLWEARRIGHETYQPLVPLAGPYTPDEIDRAKGNLAAFASTQEIREGFAQSTLESAALAVRKLEAVRKQVWEDRHGRELARMRQRWPIGAALVGLGLGLAAVWTWAARMLWRKYGTVVNPPPQP